MDTHDVTVTLPLDELSRALAAVQCIPKIQEAIAGLERRYDALHGLYVQALDRLAYLQGRG